MIKIFDKASHAISTVVYYVLYPFFSVIRGIVNGAKESWEAAGDIDYLWMEES